jgi:hypothetical protein
MSLFFSSCSFVLQHRQINTKITIQNAIWEIDEFHKANGRFPSEHELREQIQKVGKRYVDEWRQELVYRILEKDGVTQYVLLSRGGDGRIDEPDPSMYVGSPEEDVNGKYGRDIVAVDGDFVRNVGKP